MGQIIAAIHHPRRKDYHASLACARAATKATDDTLTVATPAQVRARGRRACAHCWEPGGYDVLRDDRLAHVKARRGVVA